MKQLIEAARRMARGAGDVLRRAYAAPIQVSYKGMVDPVTSADKASEDFVRATIARDFPEHAVLAEESGASGVGAPWRWVIDPLDGTVNFAHKLPHFCVLIALQEKVGDDYETVLGVTYDPLREEEFVAVRGQGATLNGVSIKVSPTEKLLGSLVATGFGYNRLVQPPDNHAEFCRINLITQGVRRLGSAGLDLAYVACGRMDMYWEYNLNLWDMAPGILLVREAGGMVTALDGSPQTGGTLLSSNGLVHRASVAALGSVAQQPINSRRGLEAYVPAELVPRLSQMS